MDCSEATRGVQSKSLLISTIAITTADTGSTTTIAITTADTGSVQQSIQSEVSNWRAACRICPWGLHSSCKLGHSTMWQSTVGGFMLDG